MKPRKGWGNLMLAGRGLCAGGRRGGRGIPPFRDEAAKRMGQPHVGGARIMCGGDSAKGGVVSHPFARVSKCRSFDSRRCAPVAQDDCQDGATSCWWGKDYVAGEGGGVGAVSHPFAMKLRKGWGNLMLVGRGLCRGRGRRGGRGIPPFRDEAAKRMGQPHVGGARIMCGGRGLREPLPQGIKPTSFSKAYRHG